MKLMDRLQSWVNENPSILSLLNPLPLLQAKSLDLVPKSNHNRNLVFRTKKNETFLPALKSSVRRAA
jgi:hypothetical protein